MKFKDTGFGDLTGQIYEGDIWVDHMGLTSLEGSPKKVHGDFVIRGNKLTSLKFSPREISGDLNALDNQIKSLIGGPTVVGAVYNVRDNEITSLEGIAFGANTYYIGNNDINPFLKQELDFRLENPRLSEKEIQKAMYKLTKSKFYMPEAVKKIFLQKA